jgi:hypothetical protein
MRGYWIRIGLGALAVFLVGYGAIALVRSRVLPRLNQLATQPVRIPLGSDAFVLDGTNLGSVREVVFERRALLLPRALHFRVQLADSVSVGSLAGCRPTMVSDSQGNLPREWEFRCLEPEEADSDLVRVGTVQLVESQGDRSVVLWLLLRPEVAARFGPALADSIQAAVRRRPTPRPARLPSS